MLEEVRRMLAEKIRIFVADEEKLRIELWKGCHGFILVMLWEGEIYLKDFERYFKRYIGDMLSSLKKKYPAEKYRIAAGGDLGIVEASADELEEKVCELLHLEYYVGECL